VAASPGLKIVERPDDLTAVVRAIRSGEAISAVYVPANFERDLKAERRPQVVAFYNQQFLTAAGIAASSLSDSLNAAATRAAAPAAPKPSRIGALIAETIVLVNPEKNYAQFLLRTLLPMVLHVIVTIAAGYAVGSEFRRRSMRSWLVCAGGNPIVALAGKLAPLFGIFFLIMLSVPLILEGNLGIPFKGNLPMMVVAASLLIIGYLALGALLQLLVRDLTIGLGLTGRRRALSRCSLHLLHSTRCLRSFACARLARAWRHARPRRSPRPLRGRKSQCTASAELLLPNGSACSGRAGPSSSSCWRRLSTVCITRSPTSIRSFAKFQKLGAPYFSSHCPTLKTHEFSSGSSPERRASRRHRIRCSSLTGLRR
jgi:ABC-2 family transporter protein